MTERFVSEDIIDRTAEKIGASDAYFQSLLKDFQTQQPYIFSYIFSGSFSILTQEEKEYLLYLALVVWKSTEEVLPSLTIVGERDLGEKEELNWLYFEEAPGRNFRDKLNVFFEDYAQEDLLAFAEDALVIDEEEEEVKLTKEGQTPIFIALRTIIDCLIAEEE